MDLLNTRPHSRLLQLLVTLVVFGGTAVDTRALFTQGWWYGASTVPNHRAWVTNAYRAAQTGPNGRAQTGFNQYRPTDRAGGNDGQRSTTFPPRFNPGGGGVNNRPAPTDNSWWWNPTNQQPTARNRGYTDSPTDSPVRNGGANGGSQGQGSGKYLNTQNQLDFLKRFGYLSHGATTEIGQILTDGSQQQPAMFTQAIRKYQKMMDIPQTGVMDATTRNKMAAPRCGNRDTFSANTRNKRAAASQGGGLLSRTKRWEHYGESFPISVVTWKIVSYSRQMDHYTQTEILTRAFRKWESVISLRFRQEQFTPDHQVNVRVGFYKGEHGDGYPFDGPRGTLGHAFFLTPFDNLHSQIDFDDDEEWTERSFGGINLDWVAVHEMGHVLGMAHSDVRNAIMYAAYPDSINPYAIYLTTDDITGVRARYGGVYTRHLCEVGVMTAILSIRSETYMFINGDLMTAYNGIIDPKVLTVNEVFTKNSNIQLKSVFSHNNHIYVIQGPYITEYSSNFIFNTTRDLSSAFDFNLGECDATFTYNGKLYVVEGRQFHQLGYQLWNNRWVKQNTGYLSSTWQVPNSCTVDAATETSSGKIFFFCRDGNYYVYSANRLEPYPKRTSTHWWGCRRQSSNLMAKNGNNSDNNISRAAPIQLRILEDIHAHASQQDTQQKGENEKTQVADSNAVHMDSGCSINFENTHLCSLLSLLVLSIVYLLR